MYVLSLVAAAMCIQSSLAGYCHRPNFDCSGHDIHFLSGDTDECKEACDSNLNCKSIQSRSGACWLKDHACENHELMPWSPANDYVKHDGSCEEYEEPEDLHYCHRPGKRCWGHDIKYTAGASITLEMCQKFCSFQRDCRSIYYEEEGGHCRIKSHRCVDDQLVDAPGGHDYVKNTLSYLCPWWENAPSFAAVGYCSRNSFDCLGHESNIINHFTGTNAACRDACDADPECKSIQTYGNSECWLKRHACLNHELRPAIGFKDWVKERGTCEPWEQKYMKYKYCHRPGKQCKRHDIVDVESDGLNDPLVKCRIFCNFQRDCRSFRLDYDGHCWLKRHRCTDEALEPNPDGDDYYKVLADEDC